MSPIYVQLSALIPAAVLGIALTIKWQRLKRIEKPPQSEKLLRPAGFSVSMHLDETLYSALYNFSLACAVCPLAVASADCTSALIASGYSRVWTLLAAGIFLLATCAAIFCSLRVVARLRHARNLRLGLRGEQAVAEVLHEVADRGYHVFHDLPAGQDWNIDHIAVGAAGVFAIETKARRRRVARNGQRTHVAQVKDDRIVFPSGTDLKAIPQAELNAKWLASYLRKKTGEAVHVDALVALPGWYVEHTGTPSKTLVMNAPWLAGHLRRQPDRLPSPQVYRIIAALDEKCRDLEF